MLINRVAFCISSSLNAVPSGPWRCLALEYRRMRAEEMNECVMNGNGTSVCRSREVERLKMKRGKIREDVRTGRAEGDARYSASEGVLVFLMSPTLFHTGTHTRRRIHSHCNAKKQSRHAYEDAFSASSFFPPILSVTAIVQGGNERPSALVRLSPAVPWLSAEPLIVKSCSFYCCRMLINPNVLFGVERPEDAFNISKIKLHTSLVWCFIKYSYFKSL